MRMADAGLDYRPLAGAVPAAVLAVDEAQVVGRGGRLRGGGARLGALWGTDRRRSRRGLRRPRRLCRGRRAWPACACAPPAIRRRIRTSHRCFPAASRMQRAMFDCSACARAAPRTTARGCATAPGRPTSSRCAATPTAARRFEIRARALRVRDGGRRRRARDPVGPIHAGIIEPGHLRFSIVGEKVLRLEQRLGYVHKGIDKRFEGMPLADAHRLAGRVCGDSTVAYAWPMRWRWSRSPAARWRRARPAARATARARAGGQSPGRSRRARQRRRARLRPGAVSRACASSGCG